MEKYIGIKLIEAEEDYILSPHCERKEGYRIVYKDGYESWSPKDVFEEAYRRIDNLTFGLAIEGLKKGFKVARKGWNGKGMFIYYVPASSYPAMTEIAKKELGDMISYNPYFAIKNVNGTVSTWVPSINDCLAEDWLVVE